MDWDRRRFEDRRGGESYRPAERTGRSPSRGYEIRRRSPPRARSPRPRSRSRTRPQADTWVPPSHRGYGRARSRSPPTYRRRSRTPLARNFGPTPYERRRSPPRRFSPRRDERIRSPPQSWRSKSPFSDDRSRDVSCARTSPRRLRDTTPGSQSFRPTRRDAPTALGTDKFSKPSSPRVPSDAPLSQSPLPIPRREAPPDGASHIRTLSPSRLNSPPPALSSHSNAVSRNPSPGPHKPACSSTRTRSRSPPPSAPSQRSLKPMGRSPYRDENHHAYPPSPSKWPEHENRAPDGVHSPSLGHQDHPQSGGPRISGNIPTQPKNHNASPLPQPPSGPYQGPRPPSNQHRSPQNAFLSAPTRPRRGPGSREPWMGTPVVRRGSGAPSLNVPVGPRSSFSPPTPGGGGFRQSVSRQPSTSSSVQPSAQRAPNHLAGISALIPEGRCFPSLLDPAVEKRLSLLEADKEKLLEQIAETQRTKRLELRDWDRLDREGAICALKSELAEGHLQRMADESIGGGILF